MKKEKSVLMMYIEPTPYIVGLIERLNPRWCGEIKVAYLGANLSQAWDLELPSGTFLIRGGGSGGIRQIWRTITETQPSLLHLAGWGHPLLFAAILIGFLRRIPITIESDTSVESSSCFWKRYFKRILYPVVFRIPKIFFPGGSRQRTYLKRFGVEEKKIVVANMTVDTIAITAHVERICNETREQIRTKLGLNPNSIVFLYVGRLEAHKGIHILLDSFAQLRSANKNVELLLVGDGAYRGYVEDRLDTIGGLVYVGRRSGQELLDMFAVGDVMVVPSLFEPWGLVVNEAMAAGLPIIASDRVGCVDDLVLDGKNGFVVEAECLKSLTTCMIKLAWDEKLRCKMASKSLEIIKGWSLEDESEILVKAWNRD